MYHYYQQYILSYAISIVLFGLGLIYTTYNLGRKTDDILSTCIIFEEYFWVDIGLL